MNRTAPHRSFEPPPRPPRTAPCPACVRLRAWLFVLLLCLVVDGPAPHAAGVAGGAAAAGGVTAGVTAGVAAAAASAAAQIGAAVAPAVAGAASAVARAVAVPASAAASVAASAAATVASAAASSVAASASAAVAGPIAASAAASMPGAITSPVLPSTPSSPPTPASAAATGACAGPGASAPDCPAAPAPELQWLFTTVPLPPARLDEAYGPKRLVEGGRGAYSFVLVAGRLPPGLVISAEGRLGGTPTLVGSFTFTLRARDASSPVQSTQQAYTMRVLPPRAPAAAAKAAPAASTPTALTRVTSDDASLLVSEAQAINVRSWQLTAANLDALAPPAEAASAASGAALAASGAASAAVPAEPSPKPAETPSSAETAPLADQLRELLAPLVNVEYPTRELFELALTHVHCSYFRALTSAAARKQGIVQAPVDCPPLAAIPAAAPRSAGRAASAAGADGISLAQLYTQLLPADYRQEVIRLAEKSHAIADAKPVQWFGNAAPAGWLGSDCACAPPAALGETYAFYPFWLADGAPQPLDFGLFRRIGYLGAIPDDAGGYVLPPGWDSTQAGFTRTAQRYGTAVDLVLYRRDWRSLLQQPAAQQLLIAQQAATNAMKLVDTTPDDTAAHLRRLLLPFWSEPSRLYGGLTVFFDDPSTTSTDRKAFHDLYRAFMHQLITAMRNSSRRYTLNIVVPEQRLGERGSFGFDDLIEYLELAEPAALDAASTASSTQTDDTAGARFQLRFLVLLAEPTSDHKKSVREKLDRSEFVKGQRRNQFLKSLQPVLFYPGGTQPATLAPEAGARLDADLQYFWWNFGNVAFWTAPISGAGPGGAVGDVLAQAFALRGDGALQGLCRFVCPNRVPLRLLFQALVLIGAISIGLFVGVCRVRSLGRPYLVFLLAGGAVTLLVAAALLSCDPALDGVRTGNSLFYAVIAALFVAGAFALLRPRVDKP